MTSQTNSLKTARRSIECAIDLSKRRKWYADGESATDTTDAAKATDTKADAKGDEVKTEAKFTQADMDKIAGNRAKEAAAKARAALLKELGIENPDDPKALETVKGELTAAQQAKEAQKSAETKLQEKIAALEAKAAEAETKATAAEEKRKETLLNTKLEGFASKVGAEFPEDVVVHAYKHYVSEVTALMADDGNVDTKKAEALIEKIKAARPNFFNKRATSLSTGSHGTGRSDNNSVDDAAKAAQLAGFNRTRRAT